MSVGFLNRACLIFVATLPSAAIFATLPEAPTWSLEADFLYWQPSEERLDFATISSTSKTFQPTQTRFKQPPFEWAPGFALGIAKSFPDWNLSLAWTYYASTSHKKVSAGDGFLQQLWVPFQFGTNALEAKERWHLLYNTVDLLASVNFQISKRIDFDPYFGLRGLFVDQDLKVAYRGGDFSQTQPMKLKGVNDFNAFGLHLGFDLALHYSRQFQILGSGAFSLLYGQFKVTENVGGLNVLVNQSSRRLFHENQKFFQVTTDLAASLGFKWEPFHLRGKELSFLFAYEIIKLFGQNQFRRYNTQNPQNRLGGDLNLQGIRAGVVLKI